MFSLGTGIMRLVNIGLIGALIIIAAIAAWNSIKNKYRDEGRQEVTEQIQKQNEQLDTHVREVNETITRRVVNTTEVINRQSQDVEDVINAQPTETLSNVSSARLDVVRRQQAGNLREAGGSSVGPNP